MDMQEESLVELYKGRNHILRAIQLLHICTSSGRWNQVSLGFHSTVLDIARLIEEVEEMIKEVKSNGKAPTVV